MENTLENKAKFFALYWGQEVLMHPNYYNPETTRYFVSNALLGFSIAYENKVSYQGYYIELKSLLSISNKDAVEVAKILNIDFDSFTVNAFYDSEWIDYTGSSWNEPISPFQYLESIDYLRSKGYALPYMSISVEKMTEWGWIKLIEE